MAVPFTILTWLSSSFLILSSNPVFGLFVQNEVVKEPLSAAFSNSLGSAFWFFFGLVTSLYLKITEDPKELLFMWVVSISIYHIISYN